MFLLAKPNLDFDLTIFGSSTGPKDNNPGGVSRDYMIP